jgi:hypothetical protein
MMAEEEKFDIKMWTRALASASFLLFSLLSSILENIKLPAMTPSELHHNAKKKARDSGWHKKFSQSWRGEIYGKTINENFIHGNWIKEETSWCCRRAWAEINVFFCVRRREMLDGTEGAETDDVNKY